MTQKPANGGLFTLAYTEPISSSMPGLRFWESGPKTSFSFPIDFRDMGWGAWTGSLEHKGAASLDHFKDGLKPDLAPSMWFPF